LNFGLEDVAEAAQLYPQVDAQPFKQILSDCKNLCEGFLKRQEQQAKSAGGSRGA